jgi:hypothetical protein
MEHGKHKCLLRLSGGLLVAVLFSGLCTGNRFYLLNGVDLLFITFILLPICHILLLITSGLRRSEDGKRKISITVTDILLSIYIIYSLFHVHGTLDRAGMLGYLSLSLLYFYFRNIELSAVSFPFSVIIVAGIWQIAATLKEFPHNEGVFYNTGMFGCFLAVTFILATGAAMYFYKTGHRKAVYVSIVILSLLVMQLIVLKGRTAWIAAVSGLIVLMFVEKVTYQAISYKKASILYDCCNIVWHISLSFCQSPLHIQERFCRRAIINMDSFFFHF